MTEPKALTEIDVAYQLNFKRWRDFQRSLKEQLIPQPDLQVSDGPRWSERSIEKWLDGELPDRSDQDEQELIESLTNG